MPILMSCSDCGFTAEVADHLTLNAVDGVVDYLALRCTAGHHQTMEHAFSRGRIDAVLKGVHGDIVSFGNTSTVRYREMCLAIFGRLNSLWPRTIGALSARARWCSIGAATVALALLAVIPIAGRQGVSADSGISACRALAGGQVAAADYPGIRAQLASSRRPELRAAGTAYLDLLVKLRDARRTDGYEAIWFYQRLSHACAKHGRNLSSAPDKLLTGAGRRGPGDGRLSAVQSAPFTMLPSRPR